jgi:hypothetical protein
MSGEKGSIHVGTECTVKTEYVGGSRTHSARSCLTDPPVHLVHSVQLVLSLLL